MIDARHVCRNTMTTSTTSRIASKSVSTTARSSRGRRSSGRRRCGSRRLRETSASAAPSSARTWSDASRALVPGRWKMPIATAGWLSSRLRSAYSSAPSSTRPTSRTRVICPSGVARTTMSPNSSSVVSRPRALTESWNVRVDGRRRRAEDAGGHLHVLLADRADDVGRRQLPRRQAIRIEPDAHAVLAGAEHLRAADAGECAPVRPSRAGARSSTRYSSS